MARRFRRKQDEEITYWLSYSDMMAGLLLCFVLIISLTVLHANIQYDQKQAELYGKEQELLVRKDELEEERQTVSSQRAILKSQEEELAKQALKLTEQEKELLSQQLQLAEQGETLQLQSELLEELQELMLSQQAQLDKIIGVRSELIEALKREFQGSNLQIAVDERTGAITLDSSILFEYNADELKESGQAFLAEFLPRYTRILMDPKYREYVSEIIIEGHTDTTGNYLFNLDLSQKRAYSVAAYCLSDANGLLSASELQSLREVLSTTGKSYSNPVLRADGSVDMEASRRVEILFRLKDEEMIREMIAILNTGESTGVSPAASASTSTASAAGPGGPGNTAASTASSGGPGVQTAQEPG